MREEIEKLKIAGRSLSVLNARELLIFLSPFLNDLANKIYNKGRLIDIVNSLKDLKNFDIEECLNLVEVGNLLNELLLGIRSEPLFQRVVYSEVSHSAV